jgi:threonylcarbamoyladenosine tRNA methylthiotransferase MtaB
MNRKYDTARFFAATELLRRYFPGCALTCDLITGFPGETDADQAETLAFIEKCAFSDMHIFPYSRRPGTPADAMPEQCTHALKAARAREAQAVAERMHRAYLEQSLGQTLPVLFETGEEGSLGHSDTYLLVKVEQEGLRGRLLDVEITGVDGERLVGVVKSEK